MKVIHLESMIDEELKAMGFQKGKCASNFFKKYPNFAHEQRKVVITKLDFEASNNMWYPRVSFMLLRESIAEDYIKVNQYNNYRWTDFVQCMEEYDEELTRVRWKRNI